VIAALALQLQHNLLGGPGLIKIKTFVICHIPNCAANRHLESAVIKIVHSHEGKYTN